MKKAVKIGILQALEVSVYIAAVAAFMQNAEKIFGRLNNFSGPIIVLLLLSTSILICGIIVFLKPYKLFVAGKKKEAMETVIYTAAGLFAILLLVLAGLLIFR